MINTYIKYIFIGLLPIFFFSCFAAKEYERPEIDNVTADYYRTDNLPADSLSLALVPWREIFTDTLLQKHIAKGLESNIDIRVAIQQMLIAQAYVKQGRAAYLPTLDATAQYTRNELSENSQFGGQFSTLDIFELSAGLSWEADIWGKIRSNKRAFQADYLQSVAAHKAVKSQLVASIASSYYSLLALDAQLMITEKTIETRENSLSTTKELKKAGLLTAVAVKQTEAQLYTAQGLLVDIERNINILENTLSVLLGIPPQQIDRTRLDIQRISTPLTTGVPTQLLANRPDVIAAEYDLINSFELTNVARSNFYPSLTLTAGGGLQSLDFADLFKASSLFANVITGLTQPIFNGRKIRTQYEVSQARQEQARLNFSLALLTASSEVSSALYSYQAASQKIVIKEKEYEAYQLATEYSQELLDNGLANYLEVLRANENTLNTSLDLVNARDSQLQAVVSLYKSLGGGWQ